MKRILIIIMAIGLLLMCACENNRLTTDEALGALLNSDNYKKQMSIQTKETVNERGHVVLSLH